MLGLLLRKVPVVLDDLLGFFELLIRGEAVERVGEEQEVLRSAPVFALVPSRLVQVYRHFWVVMLLMKSQFNLLL